MTFPRPRVRCMGRAAIRDSAEQWAGFKKGDVVKFFFFFFFFSSKRAGGQRPCGRNERTLRADRIHRWGARTLVPGRQRNYAGEKLLPQSSATATVL